MVLPRGHQPPDSGASQGTHAASRSRSGRLEGRERAPSSSAAERASSRLGLTARSGPEHPDAASLCGNHVRAEQSRGGAPELRRDQALARSVPSTRARPNPHVPSPRSAGGAGSPPERKSSIPHFSAGEGRESETSRTQSPASPSPRSPPRAPPIAASATSIAAGVVCAFCSERSPPPSCSPSAGRATRTPGPPPTSTAPPRRRERRPTSALGRFLVEPGEDEAAV